MIVAMGVFEFNGTGHQVFGINVCTWVPANNCYDIALVDRSYYYLDYVTVVTPAGSFRYAAYGSVGGHLLVYIYDSAGNPIQSAFSVTILKINP